MKCHPITTKLSILCFPLITACFLISPCGAQAQNILEYELRTIAFYNVENLFDTRNDSLVLDDYRTPKGKDRWTMERYFRKISSLAYVLSDIGSELGRRSPDLVGMCEVENYEVLQDLVNHPQLKPYQYGIVHFDSPDERGIDVALLYKKAAFIPDSFRSHRLLLFDEKENRDYTRDQLVVGGWLDGEHLYLLVNHWPSRSGGRKRSDPYRRAAARLNKKIIDSLLRLEPEAKIISMGDLNDNPTDPSLKEVLRTSSHKDSLTAGELYNPMEMLYKKGYGSLAYRDEWHLFDQIFLTGTLLDPDFKSYSFLKAGIFRPSYLQVEEGKYRGYPFRTYSGGAYSGGYSDHFPVYIYLLRKAQ